MPVMRRPDGLLRPSVAPMTGLVKQSAWYLEEAPRCRFPSMTTRSRPLEQ
jgi:hypothetical protein